MTSKCTRVSIGFGVVVGFTILGALLAIQFNVCQLPIPHGFTLQLAGAFDQGRRPQIFAPPPTLAMNRNDDAVVVVSRTTAAGRSSAMGYLAPPPAGQELVIFHACRIFDVVKPPSSADFGSKPFGAPGPLDAQGHPLLADLQISSALISAAAKVYVTQQHLFDGAYSGVISWSFSYGGGSWRPEPALSSLHAGQNQIVTAAYDDGQIGYNINYEAEPNYQGSDAQTGLIDQDEAWIRDLGVVTSSGNGTISAVSNRRYAGYDAHFFPAPPHFDKPPDAFEWVGGRRRDLGHGLAWAVNHLGIVVGDNRVSVTSPGRPIAWYHETPVAISSLAGSAFGINDRNQIVGDIETRGAYMATMRSGTVSLEMLDTDLSSKARGWHIEHAYAISSDSSIFALARFKSGPQRIVLLIPD